MGRGGRLALVVAVAFLGSASGPPLSSLAQFADGATAGATFTTDVLEPASGLAVSAGLGLTATLTWTATPDAYAGGYRVYRSATSGTGFTLVTTVAGAGTTTASDTPLLPGTYYYVVRSFAGGWTSPATNEVSVLLL